MSNKKIGLFVIVISFLILVVTNVMIWKWEGEKPVTTEQKSPTSSSEEDGLPAVSLDDWELVLVNRDHLLETEPQSLTSVDEIQVDSRIATATKQFLEAARAIAPNEMLLSGYRSRAEQEQLYNDRVAELEVGGMSREEAEAVVGAQVQIPGASEHQTGLAVDMSEEAGQLDEVAEKIKQIAPQYGFVLRYPEGKSQITGIEFENWHFRYVGIESAKYMQEHDLVLEEYLALLKEKK